MLETLIIIFFASYFIFQLFRLAEKEELGEAVLDGLFP
jgi:hypothetical protein